MPTVRKEKVYESFTAEIDLKGHPTWHSSAIPVKFYEAIPTPTVSFDISLRGLVGSIWIEGTKKSTINLEAFKGADYLWSATYSISAPGDGVITTPDITVGDYQYLRISYTTPTSNGVGASFQVTKTDGSYDVTLRSGGTGYSVGGQIKVLGSAVGGTDGINDLIIHVTHVDAASSGNVSSYAYSSITDVDWTGEASAGYGNYIVTGTNITGVVDKVTLK